MFLPKVVTHINSFEMYPIFLADPVLEYSNTRTNCSIVVLWEIFDKMYFRQ